MNMKNLVEYLKLGCGAPQITLLGVSPWQPRNVEQFRNAFLNFGPIGRSSQAVRRREQRVMILEPLGGSFVMATQSFLMSFA